MTLDPNQNDRAKLLHIYLNDHLAGSVAGSELARRCRDENRGTPLAEFLDDLVRQIEEDQLALEAIMDAVGAARNPAKLAAAWLAEKVGRLKLNGQLLQYSDLSRLLELEGLGLGIHGKAETGSRGGGSVQAKPDPRLIPQLGSLGGQEQNARIRAKGD